MKNIQENNNNPGSSNFAKSQRVEDLPKKFIACQKKIEQTEIENKNNNELQQELQQKQIEQDQLQQELIQRREPLQEILQQKQLFKLSTDSERKNFSLKVKFRKKY